MDWYVLRTQPLYEDRVSKDLNRLSVETLLPLARMEVRLKSGLLVERLKPLFRSYLFLRLNWDNAPKYAIQSTRFAKGFLGYNEATEKASIVRERDMEELRSRLAECGGVIPLNLSRPKPIEPGVMIRVLFGPFRDHAASVKAVSGSRVQVLLSLLKKDHDVWLPKDCLAVAA